MILSITSIGFLRAKILFSSLFFRTISVKGCLTTGVQVGVALGEGWADGIGEAIPHEIRLVVQWVRIPPGQSISPAHSTKLLLILPDQPSRKPLMNYFIKLHEFLTYQCTLSGHNIFV